MESRRRASGGDDELRSSWPGQTVALASRSRERATEMKQQQESETELEEGETIQLYPRHSRSWMAKTEKE